MAWYRRGYRRGGRRYGSSLRRRSRGNIRAAFQQNDSSTMTMRISSVIEMSFQPNSQANGNIENAYHVLANSPMFQAISQLYDQVKVDAVRVKLAQSYANGTYQNIQNPATIVTYWDRNGVDGIPTIDQAGTYSSAIKTTALVGGTFKQTRYIYASTMQEKSFFVPVSRVDTMGQAANAGATETVPWKPTFGITFRSNVQNGDANAVVVARFQLEWAIVCTFRGMRQLP